MNSRIYQISWLALLLASCDKSARTAAHQPPPIAPPQVTKSTRPPLGELPNTREPQKSPLEKTGETLAPEERNRALSAAVWDAIELDPEGAQKGFQQMTAGSEEKNRLLEHFAMRLAEQNPDDAVRWANALGTDEEKSLAFGKIATVLSEKEPERAARVLSDSGVAGRDFDVAVVQVVQRWAAISPADAAAWVVLFDAGEARSASLKEVVSVWMTANPQAAFSWISGLQDEATRQEAELGAAQSIVDLPEESQADLLKSASAGIKAGVRKLQAEAEKELR